MLSRSNVIQQILSLFASPSYLEVGVNEGITFHEIQAENKIAVDPKFLFDTKNNNSLSTQYYEITSDEYFAKFVDDKAKFDVIYLDGLHTAEQTLRDILNAIQYISARGVIVIDDTVPNSYDASLTDYEQVRQLRSRAGSLGTSWQADGSWMGDVYKNVFFIASFMQQWSYATIQENHGQTVMWRQRRNPVDVGRHSLRDIASMDYRNTILEREHFRVLPLNEIVDLIRNEF